MRDGRNGELPPLMVGIAGAVVVLALGSKTIGWIKMHEAELLGMLGLAIKGAVVLGLVVALAAVLFRATQGGVGWIREVSSSILKIESEVDALDERHNYSKNSLSYLDSQVRALKAEIAELRKFTGFDEEFKKQQKLQQAMSSLGVNETPNVKEQDDKACAEGSEPAQSY